MNWVCFPFPLVLLETISQEKYYKSLLDKTIFQMMEEERKKKEREMKKNKKADGDTEGETSRNKRARKQRARSVRMIII